MLYLHSTSSTLSGFLSGVSPPSFRLSPELESSVCAVPCANRYGSRVPLCHGALFAINNYASTTSARPKQKFGRGESTTEVEELVRVLLRKAGDEKFPLVTTLNKYVRTVRTEHCFLLFEELGRQDKWLQCLEVSIASMKKNA